MSFRRLYWDKEVDESLVEGTRSVVGRLWMQAQSRGMGREIGSYVYSHVYFSCITTK